MFLQGPKAVLKDGAFRTLSQSVQKLAESTGFVPSNAQKMCRRVEVERFDRSVCGVRDNCGGCQAFTAIVASVLNLSPSWHAWSHRFRKSNSSSGGFSHSWAAVFRQRGRTNILRPWLFT